MRPVLSAREAVLCILQNGTKGKRLTASGPSFLSLAAAVGYAAVVLACLGAATHAKSDRLDNAHTIGWVIIASFFALLLIARLLSLEELLRDELREWLRVSGDYEGRRAIQLPLAIAVMIAAFGVLIWLYRGWIASRGRRDRAYLAAKAGVAAMIALILLRTVSFSTLDKLLYGPLKLNWVGDIGAALLVLGAALFYARIARQTAR
jgi:hypothetical protein